ncbi:MAG TPA: DUF1844 domain-containing protein [Blastocatellia bacterium]|nr:DUF1844 domain-containing protein [Blastocatellia bacterium]
MAEEKDTSFKVTDRRKFHSDGTPREQPAGTQEPEVAGEQAAAQAEEPPSNEGASNEGASGNVVSFPGEASRKREQGAAEPSPDPAPPFGTEDREDRAAAVKAAAAAAEQAYNQTNTGRAAHLPEPSFLALTDMLAGEAAMSLGLAQTPDGGRLPVDLETARTMIDMLGMLDQKTRGNLTEEESAVLENVLGYLRMQFVALSRKQ